MSVFHMVTLHIPSVLKHLHSSCDASGSLLLTSYFCLLGVKEKVCQLCRTSKTFPPLQECESLLSCLVTPALFSVVAKHLCHSLEAVSSDASALSLPVYFNDICVIPKVKGLAYFFLFSGYPVFS